MSTTSETDKPPQRAAVHQLRTRGAEPATRTRTPVQAPRPQPHGLTPLMGPADHAPGPRVMGGPDAASRLNLMGGPDAGSRLNVMGSPDRGPRLDVMGQSDTSFVDSLFTGHSSTD